MWYEGLERNVFISKLYTVIPQLKSVRISQIGILDEGEKISITFDMPCFADNVPEKWKRLGYNTVIVHVDFFNVSDLIIKSTKTKGKGNIKIKKDTNGTFEVNIDGSIEANIKAELGVIQSVDGYCNQQDK